MAGPIRKILHAVWYLSPFIPRSVRRLLAAYFFRLSYYDWLPFEDVKPFVWHFKASTLSTDPFGYAPSKHSAIIPILARLGLDDVFYDLGCGKGNIVLPVCE